VVRSKDKEDLFLAVFEIHSGRFRDHVGPHVQLLVFVLVELVNVFHVIRLSREVVLLQIMIAQETI